MNENKKNAEHIVQATGELISGYAKTNPDGDPISVAAFNVQVAQVHATLYLAEQQRIANLIAYSVGQEATLESDVNIRVGLGLA